MRTYTIDACPACGSADAVWFTLGSASLRRCRKCGARFAPEGGRPDELYVDGYVPCPNFFEPRFQGYLAHCNNERLAILERTRPKGRLLDVGAGSGELVAAAKARGWDAIGVDPVDESARYARDVRGVDVRTALLDDSGLEENSFDAVVATHVLEHMSDAAGFLRLITRWVKPGGHLMIEVPNFRSFHRRGTGDRWIGLRPLEHVVYFTPVTLRRLLGRVGLDPETVVTPVYLSPEQTLRETLDDLGRMRWERWLSPFSLHETLDGHPVARPRLPARAVLRLTERIYELVRMGSVVVAIARKPVRSG